jgi:hypothetical protein
MNVEKYLAGRGAQKKAMLRNDIAKLHFSVKAIIQMPMTRENYQKLGAIPRAPGTEPTLHKRLAVIGNAWCASNCHYGWAKMRFPGTWCFENPVEALMFKMVFG